MKILFAIQGTGNGHISRAREIIPHLLKHGELDLLVSGTQADVNLPYLIKYKKRGLSFTFGTRGGIDMVDSIKRMRPFHYLRDIAALPVHDYDVVINDFEPISAWACFLKRKPCISLSHQASFLSAHTPRPEKMNAFGEWALKKYIPVSSAIGFHFEAYDKFIHTPVIRSEIRKLNPTTQNHITVYLPAYEDAILLEHLLKVKDVEWEVFSKHTHQEYKQKNVKISPIENEHYTQSVASSSGLVTGGGFESPAEAMFLGKKVLSVPMANQYEQLCNAAAMKKMGVTVSGAINENFSSTLQNWLNNSKPLDVHFPDETAKVVERVFTMHANSLPDPEWENNLGFC